MTLCFSPFFFDLKHQEADHYAPDIPLIDLLVLNKNIITLQITIDLQLLEAW